MPRKPKQVAHKPKQRWSKPDIERAAIRYSIEGTVLGTARIENIPEATITHWKNNSDVWDTAITIYRDQNNDRFIATANKIIDKATEVTLDKLPEATAQQAATIGAIYYDKQRLALSLPTSIRGESDSITKLAAQFEKLSRDHRNIQSSVVSVQDKETK